MPQAGRGRRWASLVALCLGQLMVVLDSTVVNVALPDIQRSLDFTQASLTWVVNAYLVTFGGLLLLAGRIGDRFGRKRVFLVGMAVFTVASVGCGSASSAELLIVARLVQGVGAAIGSSVIVAIIVTEFRAPRERGTAIGFFSFTGSAGGSLGLVLGGALTQAAGWHWIFFVNVPIGLVAACLGALVIDESEAHRNREAFDVPGSILLTAATMLAIYAVVNSDAAGWGSPETIGAGCAAAALFAAFMGAQRHTSNPILPPRLLRVRAVYASTLVRALLYLGLTGQFFLGTEFLQRVVGFGSLGTGLSYLPSAATIALLSVSLTPRLVARFGTRPLLLAGLSLAIAGLLLFARAPSHASYATDLLPPLVLIGAGAGLSFMPTIMLGMSAAAPADAGVAAGLVNVSQQLPGAVGVAVLATIAASRSRALRVTGALPHAALTAGYHLGFLLAGGSVLLGLLVAFVAVDGGKH
ncbi:MAG TPA: MFS transporter [Solirubrobacteraceae bacterium]